MACTLKNSAASEVFAKLYLNEDLADVRFVFKVDDEVEKVPASKNVLAALSPVFYRMFFGSLKEGDKVEIVDSSAGAFKEFLQFFYLSEVTLTMKNIETVVRLADKYDVLEYFKASTVFIRSQLTPDNMCWGYQLATSLENTELIDFCEEKIASSPREIFGSDVFKRCDISILERILEMNLSCEETDVFDACLSWARHACKEDGLDETQAENLKTQLGDCFKLIRFPEMNLEGFSNRYLSFKGLFTLEEYEDITLSLMRKEYVPKIFKRIPRLIPAWKSEILLCSRKTQGSRISAKDIHTVEVLSFSSNHRLLLKGFYTALTYSKLSSLFDTEVKVIVTEREDISFLSNIVVIHEGTSNNWDYSVGCGSYLRVNLTSPIMIKPQHLYEIRLNFESNNGCYYYSDCKPMVEMGDGIKIQFHRNPNLSYNNLIRGWIEGLKFNKM
ncbi:BTB/POZ domain-containing protein 6-B-like [Sitodiplosis mosellana]|uniref:BTB/POZ domain-containing protein 6-B-like n=1 Tax=Sitodiplosis mosellana TaxID=263140 RepID=UPI0024442085|nr:BTB/POZ domain-containing protein 6-B-like [Sitodiplosis mosellana]